MSNLATKTFISTREKIMQFLLLNRSKSDNPSYSTIKEIADDLGLSTNAARQYMMVLEKDGFVTRMEKKGITGRPAITYALNEGALESFPKIYKDFSLYLIEVIKREFGVTKTRDILEKVGLRIASDLRNSSPIVNSMSLKEKLTEVTDVFREYGKFPELIENDSDFTLKTHNCLVYSIVKEEPLVCAVDEILMSELAGKKAHKEKCIRDGDNYCLYRISKNGK